MILGMSTSTFIWVQVVLGLLGIFTVATVLFAKTRIKRKLCMKGAYVWILAALIAPSVFAAMPLTSGKPNAEGSSPIFGVTIPNGYRQWELVAPAHEIDPFNELRAILGNTLSMTAYRKGTLPYSGWSHSCQTGLEARPLQ